MDRFLHPNTISSRRRFLTNTGMGLGTAALASLMPQLSLANTTNKMADENITASAKRVIFLFMAGAPSQVDLFDRKPELEK
jgi:hypothetical protein